MNGYYSKLTTVAAVCTVCFGLAFGAAKEPTKPYKITGFSWGDITSFNPATMTITFTMVSLGEATHSGRYWNEFTGSLSLATLQGDSQGTFVCANGDEIYWTGTINGPTLTVTATGGTGRFAGGHGGFVADLFDIDINLDDLTLSYSFDGTGEVTY
jgi:hypothetical protein